jgi:hypothetical protein
MVLGGAAYRWIRLGGAFSTLKGLSFACGALLLALLAFQARADRRMLLVLGFWTFSIAAVDYSANGSFYILCAVLYLGFYLALRRAAGGDHGWRWGLAAGLLGTASLLTHLISAALIASIPVYLALCRPRHRGPVLLCGGVMIVSLLVSTVAWRVVTEAPTNPSLVNFLVGDGFAVRRLDAEDLRFLVSGSVSLASFPVLLGSLVSGAGAFLFDCLVVTGPLVVLFAAGLYRAVKRRRERDIGLCLSLLAGHLLIVAVFPFDRLRFIVPVLPFLFTVTALGALHGNASAATGTPSRWASPAVTALIVLFVGYNLFFLVRFPHTFYDGSRPSTARTYNEMKAAALWLGENMECGNVLGYSRLLDGGTEAYAYHRCPFVAGRAFLPYPQLLPRLVERYRVAYIWTDRSVRADRDYLKRLPAVYEGDRFLVLRADGGQ